jgi:sarcosine oxidase subunit beta
VTADVVIVGAGVVGASAAHHLASLGAKVVLLERGAQLGEGSTGRATGGFRAQYETEINVRLSLASREKLRRFADEIGADPGYQPCGYLWLAADAAQLAALRAAQRLQHALGLTEARMVGLDEIGTLQPHAVLDGVAGGAFCPTDGFLRPLAILDGYLQSARRLGAQIHFGARVDGFELREGRIESVRAAGQSFTAGAYLDAAGPWAAQVAALAGLDLPVVPLRRQLAVTAPFDGLPDAMPMTIWLRDGFHLRVRDGRVLLLWPTEGAADPFSTEVDDGWIERVTAMARSRVPALGAARIDRGACRAGLYEMSPDRHALVGRAPGFDNLWLACGSSGHGVMHAPAVGQLVAEQIVHGRARLLDATALRPERFLEGKANPLSALL